jgi:hypothetical protein
VGAGSLKILAGVIVHRATRPLRGSVLRCSGWSVPVPCVSIQLTLSQLRGSQRQTLTSVEFKIRSGGDLVCESRKYTSPYPFAIWVKAWRNP